ncbi:hypothetical protein C5167_046528 [Papaver somniferum]|uniref:OBG-type G domain-containing protein n=1 Tax=Papaver somniferum TaxID=3469 RepID=A0A4Y7LE14_PAPSO|nr:hypothetical protein C5167_046528 [Papaver somniferum]
MALLGVLPLWAQYTPNDSRSCNTPIKKPKLAPLQERRMIDRLRLWAKGGDGGNGCYSVRLSRSERQSTPDGGSGGRGVPVDTVIHLVYGEIPSAVKNGSLKALDPWEIPGALEVDTSGSNQRTKSHSSDAVEVLNMEDPDASTFTLKRSNGSSASMCETSCASSTEFQTASSFSKCGPSVNKEELISHSEIGETENKDLKNIDGTNETELDEDNMEEQEELQYNVAELTKQGQRVLVSRGGDESVLVVELKSIADVGLVGMPNAGKSTLLGAIPKAKPTVGHYAFTTSRPSIGKLNYNDFFSVTVADIPEIIKGAHENRGLGHAFLRHIERTKVLAYVVDLAAALKGIPPWEQLRDLVLEFGFHQEGLSDLPSLVVANKIDEEGTEAVLEQLKIRVQGVPIFPVCAVLGEGLAELKVGLRSLVNGGEYDCGVWTVIWKGISPSEVVCIRILVCFGDTCLTCINAACWLQGNTGSGIFTKRVIVGACHHMLGRFSSNFAKELLLSRQKVVVVHCEEICVSGGLVCQKLKALAKILWRSIRGMIPTQDQAWGCCLARFKAYEVIPPQYGKIQRMVSGICSTRVVVDARLHILGRLSSSIAKLLNGQKGVVVRSEEFCLCCWSCSSKP